MPPRRPREDDASASKGSGTPPEKRRRMPHKHSVDRVRELADPGAVDIRSQDFTKFDIAAIFRRLDTLARLLRLNITKCAAVAVDPTDGKLVIATNEKITPDTIDQVLGLFTAISNLYKGESSFTDQDRGVLYKLANRQKAMILY